MEELADRQARGSTYEQVYGKLRNTTSQLAASTPGKDIVSLPNCWNALPGEMVLLLRPTTLLHIHKHQDIFDSIPVGSIERLTLQKMSQF